MEKVIEVRDLVKDFGNVRALRGISFYVNDNEIFGRIGPNGEGKTTTLRIISTLLQVTSGNVTIFGFNITRAPEEVRKDILLTARARFIRIRGKR